MKILGLDIETAPNTAHVWGLFNQNIGINQIQQTGRVMCWAAKWRGEKTVEFASEHPGLPFDDGGVDLESNLTEGAELAEQRERAMRIPHFRMVKRAHELLDEADAVLSFNGKRFDMPTLNREFLKYGMVPPSPYHHIDLLIVAKRQFRFASNKMDHLARELGIKGKVKHSGHELWTSCMAGDPRAWKDMKRYNIQDVRMMEEIYDAMLPWIVTHPNHGMYTDSTRPVCTNCGGTDLQSRGFAISRTQRYRRYQCTDCGTWVRGRTTINSAEKRKSTLIQAV